MTRSVPSPSIGPKVKVGREYSTDNFVRMLFSHVVRDFRGYFGRSFCQEQERKLFTSTQEFRECEFPSALGAKPDFFKAMAQAQSLLKKYRFADDVYTDKQLEEMAFTGYFDEQLRLCAPRGPFRASTIKVLQEARRICRSILGKFPKDEIVTSAKFGKKSSIGCPLSLAHIDNKLSNVGAFSSSKQISEWFQHEVVSNDAILERMLHSYLGSTRDNFVYSEIESLALKNVPKSWKTLRNITPLALLNLFYSHGYGTIVTEKLKESGLNIRTLQSRHRKLVEEFSRTGSHATGDLSKASESVTKVHLNWVLPRDWYVGLKPILTHQLQYDGKEAYTASVLPMGNGATFPLETLVFYCITRAIGTLSRVNGIYSVYGDDLIFPSPLYPYLQHVFSDLGFVLNTDKTHAVGNFRESCGADFFHGVDVRPFSLQGQHQTLPRSQYICFLYKVYNGLRRRWGTCLTGTIYFILREIALTGCQLMRVPPSYPDTAGVHVDSPCEIPGGFNVFDWSPTLTVFCAGSRHHAFYYMSEVAKKRYVRFVEPYYWLSLQGLTDEVTEFDWKDQLTHETTARGIKLARTDILQRILAKHALQDDEKCKPALTWKKHRRCRKYFCKRKKRHVTKKTVWYRAQVAEKLQTLTTECLGSVTDWI